MANMRPTNYLTQLLALTLIDKTLNHIQLTAATPIHTPFQEIHWMLWPWWYGVLTFPSIFYYAQHNSHVNCSHSCSFTMARMRRVRVNEFIMRATNIKTFNWRQPWPIVHEKRRIISKFYPDGCVERLSTMGAFTICLWNCMTGLASVWYTKWAIVIFFCAAQKFLIRTNELKRLLRPHC